MASFAVAAVAWFNAYRRQALETLIRLYEDDATHACACDGSKLIVGKQALRTHWIEHFVAHPADGLAGLTSTPAGASVLYLSKNNIVQAQLTFNKQGKIAHVACGPASAQVRPLSNPAIH